LLPRLLGGRGGGHPRHPAGDGQVAYLLRAQGAQAGLAGTRAGAVTPTMECPEARVSLGVYVLGAIDPAERALVEAHLATCRDCRDELAGLAALPALLAPVNPDEVSRICADDAVAPATSDQPPKELIGTVL